VLLFVGLPGGFEPGEQIFHLAMIGLQEGDCVGLRVGHLKSPSNERRYEISRPLGHSDFGPVSE
jgi:hypothetical protein